LEVIQFISWQDVAYGVVTLLVNLTNSYEKQEIMPELIELAKFAKHHIPQEHELDDQDFIDKRIWVRHFINCCGV
jgi:hypothetical protein